ncbi:sphingomyelin phosphodiesterase [Tenacibaculum sp. nBUS_03]|uniref:sphingomyelin phosphodiesterase n=1 Tax=Tenacibaculum sp. nBUS_03 TaxID=3395320 RepID=UPI003EBB01AD
MNFFLEIKKMTLIKSLVIALSVITFYSCQVEEDTDIANPISTSSRARQQKTVKLSVMSYNVYQLPQSTIDLGGYGYKEAERARAFAAKFQDLQRRNETPDVLVIQEAFNNKIRDVLNSNDFKSIYPHRTRLLGSSCYGIHSGDCGVDITNVNGGIRIFSKYPIEDTAEHIWVAKTYVEGLANKGVSYAAIRKDGERFHIFGTHTNSDSLGSEEEIRVKQFLEMADFAFVLATNRNISRNEPIIFAGDMNTEHSEKSVMLNILNSHLNFPNIEYTGAVDHDEASYSYKNSVVKNTYLKEEGADQLYNNTLDFVVYSRDYKQPEGRPQMKVTPLKAHSGSGYSGDISDHHPVVVDFTFKY